MRCAVPTNVPPSEKILKLYEAGRSEAAGITGRPWPGSLHTIRGAPGSLKHVQPALISVLGVKPSAVAAVVIPSETAAAAIQSANLIILFPFRRKMPLTDVGVILDYVRARVNRHARRQRWPPRSGCIREHWRMRECSLPDYSISHWAMRSRAVLADLRACTQAFRGRGALPLARQCAPVARSGWVKGTGMA